MSALGLYRRGHVTWLGRSATVWHALPDGGEAALCGRQCAAYPVARFDPTHEHACVECVEATSASGDSESSS